MSKHEVLIEICTIYVWNYLINNNINYKYLFQIFDEPSFSIIL